MTDMHERAALVTGGSSGIGLACAMAFAHRGARVVIAARGRERGAEALRRIREAGGEAEFIPTDVSRPDDVAVLVARTVEHFGRLDYAVNNAAAADLGVGKLTADFSQDEWAQAMAHDLTSVWSCMKHEIGRPEEAAEAVVWLCSDAASYITGHSLIADGGMTAWAR